MRGSALTASLTKSNVCSSRSRRRSWSRSLLEQNAMQGRLVTMELDQRLHDAFERIANRRWIVDQPGEQRHEHALALSEMALGQGNEDRVLVREVLVERADRDAGALGDAVRRACCVAVARENLSSGLDDRLERGGRSRLDGPASGCSARAAVIGRGP